MIEVNGEKIGRDEAMTLIRMLYNDAKQIAGVFHGMNRSAKFRVNWPDEYKFAETNWKTFMEAARAMYAERLGNPLTPAADARKMHLALVIDQQISKGQIALGVEPDSRLQLVPSTQQFEGDKYENRKIMEQFGKTPNLRAALMNCGAAFKTIH